MWLTTHSDVVAYPMGYGMISEQKCISPHDKTTRRIEGTVCARIAGKQEMEGVRALSTFYS